MIELIDSAGGSYALDEPGVLRLQIVIPEPTEDDLDADPPSGLSKLFRVAATWR